MLVINCPSCPHLITLKEDYDRPPPWCPRCGSDLKPRAVPSLPDSAGNLWNERAAPSTAVTAGPALPGTLQAEPPAPPIPAEPRLQPRLYTESALPPEPLPPPAVSAPVPAWATLFAVACGIIPLITLGGAIPTALGFGGASGCVSVARNPKMDVPTRLILCAGITLGCWLALFGVLGSLIHLFG